LNEPADNLARRTSKKAGSRLSVCPRVRHLNAYAERFVRSITEECLSKMIFIGQASLRCAVSEYVAHYQGERNHGGLWDRLLVPIAHTGSGRGPVRKRERLGGMLNYYYRLAA